jgi:hypothetical protein
MRKDPLLRLTANLHLNHARVTEQLHALLDDLDVPFDPDDIPVPLIAARARHHARP